MTSAARHADMARSKFGGRFGKIIDRFRIHGRWRERPARRTRHGNVEFALRGAHGGLENRLHAFDHVRNQVAEFDGQVSFRRHDIGGARSNGDDAEIPDSKSGPPAAPNRLASDVAKSNMAKAASRRIAMGVVPA